MLQEWSDGKRDAVNELLPAVYDELKLRAHRYLRRERKGHTLQTTALIHEALDEALSRLAEMDEQQARIVELRYFSGLNIEDTAEALCISPSTVNREWTSAKAWLRLEMAK